MSNNIIKRLQRRAALRSREHLTVLLYSPMYFDFQGLSSQCPVAITLTSNRNHFHKAQVVLFHLPTLEGPIRLEKARGQSWVLMCMESEANYPLLAGARFMAQFDYTMTYQLDSAVPMTYFNPRLLPQLQRQSAAKTEASPAVYFASSHWNQSGRREYVQELMRWMPVDSYGDSLRNRTLPRDAGRESKLDTIARYRFT
ncbi:MAG: hypothetical protein ACRDFX_14215, partial [Chloroflexota bacterium]